MHGDVRAYVQSWAIDSVRGCERHAETTKEEMEVTWGVEEKASGDERQPVPLLPSCREWGTVVGGGGRERQRERES